MVKKKKRRWTKAEIFVFCGACAGVLFLLIFKYVPMIGNLLAFKRGDYELNIMDALLHTEFTFDNFKYLFADDTFPSVLLNTVCLNVLTLVITFPVPIIFAIVMNEVGKKFRSGVQMATNFPHFISWTVFGGIILALTNMSTGIVNPVLEMLGLSSPSDPVNLQRAEYFWGLVIISALIKNFGWNSVVYLAAISGIPQELYEAAELDGVNWFQKTIYVTLPSIVGTIIILLLLSIGSILGNNFEQFYVFQNGVNLSKSEVLATYVYKQGIGGGRYSYSSAIGLFESVVSLIILMTSNFLSKKFMGRGLY